MEYKVVTYPDERLKLKSAPIEKIDDQIKALVNDMFEAMYNHDGIGLSAVQIGIHIRLLVMDIPGKGRKVMINPEIVESSKEMSTYEEGCLSVPGISAEVTRPKKIKIEFTDIDGKRETLKAAGLLATCIQHEYDHLNGVLFVDRLPADIKVKVLSEYRKIHNI